MSLRHIKWTKEESVMIDYRKFKTEKRLTKDYKGEPRIIEVAVFEDKSIATIHEMPEDGTKYFYIENPYCKEGDTLNTLARRHFLDYPKDAVMAVREGYADALSGMKKIFGFGDTLKPVIILDRDKAEEYRKKTLEGWKDAEFAYGISFGSKSSFSGYTLRDKDGNVCLFGENEPITFKTAEEAQDYFNEHFLKESIAVAKKYIECKGNDESISALLKPYEFNLIFDLALELVEGSDEKNLKLKDLEHLEKLDLGWKIIQVVKPVKDEHLYNLTEGISAKSEVV